MSSYNRVAPRAAVGAAALDRGPALGRGVARDACRSAGSTARWRGASRARSSTGKLFAKTGTLNATNALSGYMIAASGRTLTFSVYANDIPDGTSATKAMDAALVLIAAAN